MIPDEIEIDLSALKSAPNVDRVEHIRHLLQSILFSPEVTPKADDDGNWPQDDTWEIAPGKIMLRKRQKRTFRERVNRGLSTE